MFVDGAPEAYVSVPHHPALNPYPFTVTAWIRVKQPPGSTFPVPIISKSPSGGSEGWSIQLLGGQIYASYGVDGANRVPGFNGGFIVDGQWHHVAFVVDASGGRVYLDGALQASQSWLGTPGPPATTINMLFGTLLVPPNTSSFHGSLDEITVWNTALSQAQIQFNMHRSLTGTEPGLLGYYRCDETTYGLSADSAPAAGANNGGWFGAVNSIPSDVRPFTPFVETLGGGPGLEGTNATLSGVANPEGATTAVWFQWGTSTNYENVTALQAMGNGAYDTNFGQVVTGLVLDLTYHFRAVASNNFGVVFGTNQTIRPRLFTPWVLFSGVYFSAAAWGDYDNDGRLDVLLAGKTTNMSAPITQVWRSLGAGEFIQLNQEFPGVFFSTAAWSDYNNDGQLDFFLAGDTNFFSSGFFDLFSRVFRNSGTGFTDANAGLTPISHGSVAWGDYDNDGRLDLLLTGDRIDNPLLASSNIVSEVWRNTSTGFTKINLGLPGVDYSSVAWVDYDNDGRLDFLLSGRTNAFTGTPITQIWRNTGSGFTNINARLPGVTGGACAWGDYDNDGRLDLLLTGYTNYTSFGSVSNIISEVWRNTGNGFSNINAGLPAIFNSSVAWGDYDNDGRPDILIAGATNFTSSYLSTGFVSQIWRNTGSGFTRVNADLPGAATGSCAWGDYDNDGRLDILLTGATKTDPNGNVLEATSQIWRNNFPQTNTPPTAPTNLTATIASNTVTFSWNAASDVQTPSGALTYNLRVGTAPGASDVVAPMSAANGRRRLPQSGNAGRTRFRTMSLPARPLYWSVQAVDNAFAGGPFSAESLIDLRPSLTISRTAGGGVVLSWPAIAADYTLQARAALFGNPPPWQTVPPPYLTNASTITVTNPASFGQSKYYRLRWQ
jgi:hypothetical protein